MESTDNRSLTARIAEEIENRIDSYCPGLVGPGVAVYPHSLEIRRWSFIFVVDVLAIDDKRKLKTIFVKIPKVDKLEKVIGNAIMDEASRARGAEEYSTLRLLHTKHSHPSTLRVVRPLGYLGEHNAILTEGFEGAPLYRICRGETGSCSLRQEELEEVFYRCGKWLADFQKDQEYHTDTRLNQDLFREDLAQYLDPIEENWELYDAIKQTVDRSIHAYGGEFRYSECMLDGFEVRNILVDRDQGPAVFDLSRTKGSLYSDLARFIASTGIIYWGTRKFVYERTSQFSGCIDAVVSGYSASLKIVNPVLDLFMLKEWVRQYALASSSIEGKHYPRMLKKTMRKLYVDPFFKREIRRMIGRMNATGEEKYRKLTRSLYRNEEVAGYYKEAHAGEWTRRNFRAKVISKLEKRHVGKMLRFCKLENKKLLDIPCGTGKAGEVIPGNVSVVASDISLEMMRLARNDYSHLERFNGFVQADATGIPFISESFDCVLNLRLLHRVPGETKIKIVREAARLSRKYVVLSFAIDSPLHRLRGLIRNCFISHDPAMVPTTFSDMGEIFERHGLRIIKVHHVLPLFSNELIVLLEKLILRTDHYHDEDEYPTCH